MNDLPRDKYEILDIIFTFLHTLCISLTAIFLLSNRIVSLIFVIVVVLFAYVVLYFWRARNPFNIYLVRAFAFNNLFFTFIALIFYYSMFSAITTHPVGYALLLFPSGIYLIISFKFSAVSLSSNKRVGARLAFTGNTKASRHLFFVDNPEEGKKREELIAKQKNEYRYNLIIALAIAFTLSSSAALIFGFS